MDHLERGTRVMSTGKRLAAFFECTKEIPDDDAVCGVHRIGAVWRARRHGLVLWLDNLPFVRFVWQGEGAWVVVHRHGQTAPDSDDAAGATEVHPEVVALAAIICLGRLVGAGDAIVKAVGGDDV